MGLKNHLFRNVIAPRDHASELHPLDASRAKGAMIRRAVMISHVPIIAMIPCVSPCCILGLPFGWSALQVLNDPKVAAAFNQPRTSETIEDRMD